MHLLGGVVTGAVLLCCCLWVSYVIAARITGPASTAVRWCGTAMVAYWLLVVCFTGLAFLSAFRLWVALGVWIVGAVVTTRTLAAGRSYGTLLRRDLKRV